LALRRPVVNILVAGSSGLVGSALKLSLSNQGHKVRTLVRATPRHNREFRWDPAAGVIDSGVLRRVDAVIHLGGAGIADKRWTDERKKELADSRILSTRLFAETVADMEEPPATFLCASANGYYGDTGYGEVTESRAAGDDFLARLCHDWEQATAPASDAGVRVANLRIGVVLTPTGGALKKQLLPFKLALGGRVGTGRQYLSWISLNDTLLAIDHLLTSDVSGGVNLTAPNPCTNQEFTDALGAALNRPVVIPVPTLALNMMLGRELTEALLMTSIRAVPQRLQEDGFNFQDTDIEPTLKKLLA
jgi:uncharacterized protein